MISFVTGGVRSGKSRYALDLAGRYEKPLFVATAEPFDDEMSERIERHRQERGTHYPYIEEPVDLAGALDRVTPGTQVTVVDCLTVWMGNLCFRQAGGVPRDLHGFPEVAAFFGAVAAARFDLILVSNEIGLGVIAADPATRLFVELLGRLNQEVASMAEQVVLLVSGLPLTIKGAPR
jgi:adenosylcobinamide kinase / adenosylcobinamide-phosphate guanylyltransferase